MGRQKKTIVPVIYTYRSFEQCYDEILRLVEMRKFRWTLSAINWMDWDDVRQQLLAHIFKKWHLYKQDKKLSSWVMTVVNNQMINMIRNYYGNYKKPCINCEFYEEENSCKKFGEISTKCELFRTWVHGKKSKHDIQLPLPMENHTNEVFELKGQNIDIEKSGHNLYLKMKTILKPLELIVYKGLFVDHKSELEVAQLLGLRSTEKGREPGYGRVSQLKKIILVKVKQVLKEGDVEIVGDNEHGR